MQECWSKSDELNSTHTVWVLFFTISAVLLHCLLSTVVGTILHLQYLFIAVLHNITSYHMTLHHTTSSYHTTSSQHITPHHHITSSSHHITLHSIITWHHTTSPHLTFLWDWPACLTESGSKIHGLTVSGRVQARRAAGVLIETVRRENLQNLVFLSSNFTRARETAIEILKVSCCDR